MNTYVPTLPTLTEEILACIRLGPRPEQIDYLLKAKNSPWEDEILRAEAEKTAIQAVGPLVHVRAIIELSNACAMDCNYCGIRRSAQVDRFSLTKERVLQLADGVIAQGYPGLLLQAGEQKSQAQVDFVADLAREIRARAAAAGKPLRLIGSIGELSYAQFAQLKRAGIDRYLLRIEASNPALFASLHPRNQHFHTRDACLGYLSDLNFAVGSGTLIGVPNQTSLDLARDILYFKRKRVDMIGMGPYLTAPGTPTAREYDQQQIARNLHTESIFDSVLRMIAVSRIVIPQANISATTAMEALSPNARTEAIRAGANVVMPVITPPDEKKKYSLYDGKSAVDSSLQRLRAQAEAVGRGVDLHELGDPKSWLIRQL